MQSPKVSVCMPMYNASRYLRECIDSVLAQTFTDFEFLIADDGSEDNSIAIIESYTDPRIRLIKREHGYISTLNNLLDEAKGEYIARMDADDIMLPSRLKHQYDYLESHTEVDVLGGGVIQFGDTTETHTHFAEYISILEMIDGCIIAHPTVMMRRQTLERLHLRYSANFAFAEDYELWVRMLKNGCIIRNLKEPLLRYRISDNQLSFTHSAQQSKLSKQIQQEALKFLFDSNYKVLDKEEFVSDSDRDLSVIIPFLNEGDEVLNTVKSVRETAGRDVEIIVINDNSTDGRDYYLELSPYNVRYYRNETRIGAALSKERGIKLCPTPYFIILDAHMRCYDSTWYTSIIDILKEKPNQLLCTNSTPLTKNRISGVAMEQKDLTPTFGAHMTLTHDRYLPFISWTAVGSVIPCINEHEIPCIYGAGYASSRNYWQSLGGLRGLIHYGCEEQFISIKAWLDGGGCRLLSSTFMGHIYRGIESAPFRLVGVLHIYNYLAICETLFPISTKCLGKAILWRLAKSQFIQASEIFRTVGRKYLPINNKTTKYDFQFILDSNSVHHPNDKVLHAIRQTECDTIEQIVKYYSNVESPGICAGMMSGVVTLAHCNAFYPNNDRISKLSLKLLQKVNYSLSSLNIEFRHGISGVGWGLMYLVSHNLIGDDCVNLLIQIDRLMSNHQLGNDYKTGFFDGIGGIFAYVSTRLQFSIITRADHHLSDSLLNYLDAIVADVLNNTSDYLTYNFALQYSERKTYSKNKIIAPRLEDIFMPLKIVPEYEENQLRGLNGYDGLFIKYLQFKGYETKQV